MRAQNGRMDTLNLPTMACLALILLLLLRLVSYSLLPLAVTSSNLQSLFVEDNCRWDAAYSLLFLPKEKREMKLINFE